MRIKVTIKILVFIPLHERSVILWLSDLQFDELYSPGDVHHCCCGLHSQRETGRTAACWHLGVLKGASSNAMPGDASVCSPQKKMTLLHSLVRRQKGSGYHSHGHGRKKRLYKNEIIGTSVLLLKPLQRRQKNIFLIKYRPWIWKTFVVSQ